MKKGNIGYAIRKGRMTKGWSQKQLAEAIHVNPSLISRWESNIKTPGGDILMEMAILLDIVPILFPGYKQEISSESSSNIENGLIGQEIARLWSAVQDIQNKIEGIKPHGCVDDSTIIQNSPFGIIVINSNGIVLSWNPMATEIFGWQPEEILGKPLPFISKNKLRELPIFNIAVVGENLTAAKKDGVPIDIVLSGGPISRNDKSLLVFWKKK